MRDAMGVISGCCCGGDDSIPEEEWCSCWGSLPEEVVITGLGSATDSEDCDDIGTRWCETLPDPLVLDKFCFMDTHPECQLRSCEWRWNNGTGECSQDALLTLEEVNPTTWRWVLDIIDPSAITGYGIVYLKNVSCGSDIFDAILLDLGLDTCDTAPLTVTLTPTPL